MLPTYKISVILNSPYFWVWRIVRRRFQPTKQPANRLLQSFQNGSIRQILSAIRATVCSFSFWQERWKSTFLSKCHTKSSTRKKNVMLKEGQLNDPFILCASKYSYCTTTLLYYHSVGANKQSYWYWCSIKLCMLLFEITTFNWS